METGESTNGEEFKDNNSRDATLHDHNGEVLGMLDHIEFLCKQIKLLIEGCEVRLLVFGI